MVELGSNPSWPVSEAHVFLKTTTTTNTVTCGYYSNVENFNKDNARMGRKGRERRDFGRVRRMWQLKTYGDKGLKKLSKFLAQITEYGCELSLGKKNKKSSFELIV